MGYNYDSNIVFVAHTVYIFNLRRACAGGLRYLCVCLSVTTLVATSVVSTLKMRYVGVYLRLCRFLTGEFSINPSVQKLWPLCK